METRNGGPEEEATGIPSTLQDNVQRTLTWLSRERDRQPTPTRSMPESVLRQLAQMYVDTERVITSIPTETSLTDEQRRAVTAQIQARIAELQEIHQKNRVGEYRLSPTGAPQGMVGEISNQVDLQITKLQQIAENL